MDEELFYLEHLSAQIDALESAKKVLLSGYTDVIESIRRIANSLKSSEGTYSFPEINKAVKALEDAKKNEIPIYLEKLLDILNEVTSRVHSTKVKILVIDDDPLICRLLQVKLSSVNREILITENVAEAEQILEEKDVSLIILDLVLPDVDGRNLLVRLRERPKTASVPIFILSGLTGTQPKTECFALGADDYFEKPFDPETLSAAVAGKLHQAAEISQESRIDNLTELPNRVAFKESFNRALSLARRKKDSLSIAIIDFDHFKNINDTYGHNTGDKVLRDGSSIISKSLRTSDLLARWGGEEFMALLPNTDCSGAVLSIERALDILRDENFKTEDGKVFQVTFSAGVLEVPEDLSLEDAIAKVDKFLYLAKAMGRNRIISEEGENVIPKIKILFADDDELIALSVKSVLAKEGFEVIHFPDGAEAYSYAKENNVSLVILDVNMPGMDGFEVLENLRKIPSYAQVPIVMLTGMGSEKDIVRGFELGADDYIIKPFLPAEFTARIHRLIKKVRFQKLP